MADTNPPDATTAIAEILKGLNSDFSNFQSAELMGIQGKLTETEGKANQSLYETYLSEFPQYASAKANEYQTTEAQTLGDRLAAMGMRGITTGGGTGPTSGALVYGSEKSLYDQGFTALINQLNVEKTTAEGKLQVANATIQAAQAEQDLAKHNQESAIGSGIGTVLGGIAGAFIGGPAGAIAGASIGGGIGAWLGSLA